MLTNQKKKTDSVVRIFFKKDQKFHQQYIYFIKKKIWLAPESFRNSPITKALVEAIEKQIPYWAKEYGGKLDRMLKGPEARFQAQKQDFLKRLESYVQESLEQVSKRIKELKFPTNPAQLAGSTG